MTRAVQRVHGSADRPITQSTHLLIWLLGAAALAALSVALGPLGSLAVGLLVIVALSALILGDLLSRRDLLAPTALFPICFVGYFLLGAQNALSAGHVPPRVLGFAALGLAGYLLGVGLTAAALRAPLLRWPPSPAPLRLAKHPARLRVGLAVMVCVGTGAAAALAIVAQTGGAPLARLEQRWELSGHLFTLAELAWVAAVWWNFDRWSRGGGLHLGGLLLLLAVAAGLAALAFRTPLMTMALVAALGYHRLVRPLRPLHVAALLVALLLFAGLYGWWRLQRTERYGGYEQFLALTGVKWTPLEPLAPLVTTIREGPVVLGLLAENIPDKYPHTHGAVTFSTVATLLPGWQRGPREWIGILARGLEHSTTPTILGFLYVDFGAVGIFAGMALLGAALGGLYHLLAVRPSLVTLWLWAHVQAVLLLSIHTGLADFRHAVLTLLALALGWATSPRPWAWLGRRAV